MRLTIINETIEEQIKALSDRHNISAEEIIHLAKSVGGKYSKFVLKLWYNNNIRLPEDGLRVKEALNSFQKHLSNISTKDIGRYNKLSEVENAVKLAIGENDKHIIDKVSKIKGEVIRKYKNFTTIEIKDEETLKKIGEGTKWCTRGSYPNCQANKYLEQYGKIYVVLRDDRPYLQYTPDFDQIMDVNDDEVNKNSEEIFYQVEDLSKIVPLTDLNTFDNESSEGSIILSNYLSKVSNDRNEDLEKIIVDKPNYAYTYAYEAIGNRWPEAEEYIAKDAEVAVSYALALMGGKRWPLAEESILNNPKAATHYAINVIRGRWPEAEEVIAKSPDAAFKYALKVLNTESFSKPLNSNEINEVEKVRFIKAEPYLAKDLWIGYEYAILIEERFPLYEETILKELKYIYDRIDKNNMHVYMKDYADLRILVRQYIREILGGENWKEAEDFINVINDKIGMNLY